jgi:hypothetical protein
VKPKRVLLPVLAALLIGAAAASTLAAASAPPTRRAFPRTTTSPRHAHKPRLHVNLRLVRRLRRTAWHWQAVIGVRRAYAIAPLRSPRALRYWKRQVRYLRRLAAHPPHKRGWLCIHRFEGSWTDSGDPYWGGLQMDRGFMSTYAPRILLRRGWANRWTPLEQMWVAERAHRSGRGYWPWPNTARYCGLL